MEYDITTKAGMETAKAARAAFRDGKTAKIGTVVGAVRRKRVLPVLPELPKAA